MKFIVLPEFGIEPRAQFVYNSLPLTIKRRRTLQRILSKQTKELADIEKEYSGAEHAVEYNELTTDTVLEYIIEQIKLSCDTTNFTQQEKELFNSEWTSDFWQEQDLTEMRNCITRFRAGT